MNFYPFSIGDYARATRHLSWDEDIAYRRMIDLYYEREAPLPADRAAVCRLVVAQSPRQKKAVDAVLAEFFTLCDDGYHSSRCDGEINRYRTKSAKASQSAGARWRNANADANASPDAMRTHSEGNANQEPRTIKDDELGYACDDLAELEVKLREAAGWQSEPSPKLSITGPIAALIQSGAILEVDVLPVVRAIASKATNRSTWNFFVPAIIRARDDRIANLTAVSPTTTASERPNERHARPHARNSRWENFAALDAIVAEAKRREAAERGGSGQEAAVELP